MSTTAAPQAAPPPPTMPGAPLLGSALDLQRRLLETHLRARRELGDVVRFTVGPPGARMVIVAVYSPEGAQEVLATSAGRYRKDTRIYAELRHLIGDGLLTSQDERWRRQKRFLQPLFTPRRVTGYAPAVAAEAEHLVHRWHGPARTGRPVELHEEMIGVALRVIGRVLFGTDLETVAPTVQRVLPVIAESVFRRGLNPLSPPHAWPTPGTLRVRRAQRDLEGMLDDVLGSRRAGDDGEDLLGLLLRARDGGQGLTDAEVREQVQLFLFAGHDTTAIALTFALHLLGHHPDAQRRAHAEVDEVVGGGALDAHGPTTLPYLTMVLKEAMRLYPSAFASSRSAAEDGVIGGYRVPAGADVAVYPFVTHRHPEHWDEPERFDPARFTPEAEAARHRYAWFPFGGGPRACIGASLSLLEGVLVLAAVLRAYRLDTPPGTVPLKPRITLHPAAPMPCRLVPR